MAANLQVDSGGASYTRVEDVYMLESAWRERTVWMVTDRKTTLEEVEANLFGGAQGRRLSGHHSYVVVQHVLWEIL